MGVYGLILQCLPFLLVFSSTWLGYSSCGPWTKNCSKWHLLSDQRYVSIYNEMEYDLGIVICNNCHGNLIETNPDSSMQQFIKDHTQKEKFTVWIKQCESYCLGQNMRSKTDNYRMWNSTSNQAEIVMDKSNTQALVVCDLGNGSAPNITKYELMIDSKRTDLLAINDNNILTVCSGQLLSFTCHSSGNPSPTINIKDDTREENITSIDTSTYNCSSIVKVTCTAENVYNSHSVTRKIQIICLTNIPETQALTGDAKSQHRKFLCAPQLCQDQAKTQTIETKSSTNTTFSICILAYPNLFEMARLNNTAVYRGVWIETGIWDYEPNGFASYKVTVTLINPTVQDNGPFTLTLFTDNIQTLALNYTFVINVQDKDNNFTTTGNNNLATTLSTPTSSVYTSTFVLLSFIAIILGVLISVTIIIGLKFRGDLWMFFRNKSVHDGKSSDNPLDNNQSSEHIYSNMIVPANQAPMEMLSLKDQEAVAVHETQKVFHFTHKAPGRYISQEGLVYVTLALSNNMRKKKPKVPPTSKDEVEYATLDYIHTGRYNSQTRGGSKALKMIGCAKAKGKPLRVPSPFQ